MTKLKKLKISPTAKNTLIGISVVILLVITGVNFRKKRVIRNKLLIPKKVSEKALSEIKSGEYAKKKVAQAKKDGKYIKRQNPQKSIKKDYEQLFNESITSEKIVGTKLMNSLSKEVRSLITQSLLPNSKVGNKKTFYLNLISNPRCSIGDVDIIKRDFIKNKKQSGLLLSLEKFNYDGSTNIISVKNISYKDFLYKSKFSFNINNYDEGLYALLVCSTSRKKLNQDENNYFANEIEIGSCLDTEAVSIYDLSKEQYEEKVKDKDKDKKEGATKVSTKVNTEDKPSIITNEEKLSNSKLYYFAPLLIKKGSVIIPKQGIHESPTSVISELVTSGTKAKIKKLISQVTKYTNLTKSIMPKSHYGKILLDLPHFEPRVCKSK